jgi:tetratricopeptide (TPR) repeat protein/class 3 adenylate cyclase
MSLSISYIPDVASLKRGDGVTDRQHSSSQVGKTNGENREGSGKAASPWCSSKDSSTPEENRKVSVLTFRAVGLDGLINVLDPPVVRSYLDSLFTELRRSVNDCDGEVRDFDGAGFAAIFAPGRYGTRHCLQSVECAVQLMEKFGNLTRALREKGIRIHCSTGIAWGPSTEATFGLSLALERAAEPDGMLASPEVAGMTGDKWNWEHFGSGTPEPRAMRPSSRKDPVGSPAFAPGHPLYESMTSSWDRFLRDGDGASWGVAIIGEPGLGKNTLAEEYAACIARGTERVVVCSGFNREGQPPMGMWFVIGGERARPGGEHLPIWLAGALRELAGTNRRAIVLVRDVHCADESSLKVLSRLLVMPPEGLSLFFILVGEHIPEQIPVNRVNIVRPSPLSRAEIMSFVDDALEGVKQAGLVDSLSYSIHKSTLGYPMFVHQTLLYMVSRGILAKGEDGVWRLLRKLTGIPPSVEAVLHSRMAGLPGEMRVGLQLAGLLGRSFRRDLFLKVHESVWGSDGEPVLEGLAVAGFLTGHGLYCHFRGSQMAGAAESLLTSENAERIHRIAANFLADGRSPGPDEPCSLETANHFASAGLYQEALPWALAALDQMVSALDCESGLHLLSRIREWPLGAFEPETARRTVLAEFQLKAHKGCHQEAIEIYDRAFALARPSDIPVLELTKARILAETGENLPAIALLEKTLQDAEPGGEIMAMVLSRLSKLFAQMGNMQKSREYQDLALELVDRNPHLMECILGNLAMTRLLAGDTVKAEELCRKALDTHRFSGNLKLRASLLGALSIIALRTGREEEGIELSTAAAEIHRRTGNGQGLCGVLGNTGSMLARSGKLTPALEALHEALEIARHLGSTAMVANFTHSIGNIFTILGRYDEAEAHFMESLSTAETTGNARMMASALTGLGSMKLGAGSLDEAGRCFSRANRMYHRAGNIIGQAHALSGAAEVHLIRGEPDRALPLVREAEVLAVAGGDPQTAVGIRFLHARILLARGMHDETFEVYHNACRGIAEFGITVGGSEHKTTLEEEMSRLGMAIQMEKMAER